jgi:FSR family fosmidomycin resistance protein-like MFS transporter
VPFFIAERDFSYTHASLLVLAATVTASTLQPLFGLLSDHTPMPWLLPASLLIGAGGIAAIGLSTNFVVNLITVSISGLGVAAFHPEAAKQVYAIGHAGRARAMSTFAVGGTAGFALGPLILAPSLTTLGPKGTLIIGLPALLCVAGTYSVTRARTEATRRSDPDTADGTSNAWRAFAYLLSFLAMQSLVFFGLLSFMPLFFTSVLHATQATASTALTLMLISGSAGMVLAGVLADKLGARRIIIGSIVCSIPLLAGTLASEPLGASILLALLGAALVAPFSLAVVLGQHYLPSRVGTASGLTLGFSIGIGGLGVPALGLIADRYGLTATMIALLGLTALALVFALKLPQSHATTTDAVKRAARCT